MIYPMTPSLAMVPQHTWFEEASGLRVVRAAEIGRRRLKDRLLVWVAGLLISVGLWLQKRYEPVVYSSPRACQSRT
jgi:hypothetical protein